MSGASAAALVEAVVEAHGGLERWRAASKAMAIFSCGGRDVPGGRGAAPRCWTAFVPTSGPPVVEIDAGEEKAGPEVAHWAQATMYRHLALPFALSSTAVRALGADRLEVGLGETPLVVHVGAEGLIARYDTPTSAHVLTKHCDFGGWVVATRCRAYRLAADGTPRRRPLLSWTDVIAASMIPGRPQ